MPNPMNWPEELPDIQQNDPQADVKKTLLQGQLDLRKIECQYALETIKLEQQAVIDRGKAFWDNEYKLAQSVHSAYLDVAKGQLERTNASAEFVQKAASAIVTVFTSVLALSFIVNQTLKAPLPPRGMAPAFFLGLSVVLATAFRAYVTNPGDTQEPLSHGLIPDLQKARRNTFIEWARRGPLTRQYWLQTAVMSLGVGVVLLPLPYLHVRDEWLWAVILGGLVATFGLRRWLSTTVR
jgi:hypothetical protein